MLLADGSEAQFDIYAATIIWDGDLRNILIEAADTDPLVGMALLLGSEVNLQVVEAGRVEITKLPRY